MSAPLVRPAWRTRAIWVCAIALLAFALLAAAVAGDHSTGFDNWMFRELYEHTGTGFARATLDLSQAAVPISICALVAIAAALARRWDVLVLTCVGPAGTVGLARYVFKPLLGRVLATDDVYRALLGHVPPASSYAVTGVFPSGHESAVASTACVLAVLTFQLTISSRLRAVLLALIGAWVVIAAIGLVRNFWHYATDTIGAIFLATAFVLGLALVLDRYFASVQRRIGARVAARRQLTRRS